MRAVVAELRGVADVVIIDSPPLQAVTDAAVLAGLVDGVVLVVELSHTSRSAVRAGSQALAAVGATVIGTVVNRVSGTDYYGSPYFEPNVALRGDEPLPDRHAPVTRADS
jgi:Mrp family chromosome partitioning ATPase